MVIFYSFLFVDQRVDSPGKFFFQDHILPSQMGGPQSQMEMWTVKSDPSHVLDVTEMIGPMGPSTPPWQISWFWIHSFYLVI